jgi:hypothetical protein
MDRLIVRKPSVTDLHEAIRDLVTMRCAPPLVISAGLLVLLTGSILIAVLTAGLTSFVHAFWARLVEQEGKT